MKIAAVGGTRGFDTIKRVIGRKRHILVDTLGLPIAIASRPPMFRTGALEPC